MFARGMEDPLVVEHKRDAQLIGKVLATVRNPSVVGEVVSEWRRNGEITSVVLQLESGLSDTFRLEELRTPSEGEFFRYITCSD